MSAHASRLTLPYEVAGYYTGGEDIALHHVIGRRADMANAPSLRLFYDPTEIAPPPERPSIASFEGRECVAAMNAADVSRLMALLTQPGGARFTMPGGVLIAEHLRLINSDTAFICELHPGSPSERQRAFATSCKSPSDIARPFARIADIFVEYGWSTLHRLPDGSHVLYNLVGGGAAIATTRDDTHRLLACALARVRGQGGAYLRTLAARPGLSGGYATATTIGLVDCPRAAPGPIKLPADDPSHGANALRLAGISQSAIDTALAGGGVEIIPIFRRPLCPSANATAAHLRARLIHPLTVRPERDGAHPLGWAECSIKLRRGSTPGAGDAILEVYPMSGILRALADTPTAAFAPDIPPMYAPADIGSYLPPTFGLRADAP